MMQNDEVRLACLGGAKGTGGVCCSCIITVLPTPHYNIVQTLWVPLLPSSCPRGSSLLSRRRVRLPEFALVLRDFLCRLAVVLLELAVTAATAATALKGSCFMSSRYQVARQLVSLIANASNRLSRLWNVWCWSHGRAILTKSVGISDDEG